MDDRKALSIPEVARLVSLGRSTLYEVIGAGRLRTVKVGRRTLVLREDLESWLSELGAERAAAGTRGPSHGRR